MSRISGHPEHEVPVHLAGPHEITVMVPPEWLTRNEPRKRPSPIFRGPSASMSVLVTETDMEDLVEGIKLMSSRGGPGISAAQRDTEPEYTLVKESHDKDMFCYRQNSTGMLRWVTGKALADEGLPNAFKHGVDV